MWNTCMSKLQLSSSAALLLGIIVRFLGQWNRLTRTSNEFLESVLACQVSLHCTADLAILDHHPGEAHISDRILNTRFICTETVSFQLLFMLVSRSRTSQQIVEGEDLRGPNAQPTHYKYHWNHTSQGFIQNFPRMSVTDIHRPPNDTLDLHSHSKIGPFCIFCSFLKHFDSGNCFLPTHLLSTV